MAMGVVKREAQAIESEGYRSLSEDLPSKDKERPRRGLRSGGASHHRLNQRKRSKQIVLSPITGEKVELSKLFPPMEDSSE